MSSLYRPLSKLSRNSEMNDSEFLENLEAMFIGYNMSVNVLFKYQLTHFLSTWLEVRNFLKHICLLCDCCCVLIWHD